MVKFGLAIKENIVDNKKLFYGTGTLKQVRRRKSCNMVNIQNKEGTVTTDNK